MQLLKILVGYISFSFFMALTILGVQYFFGHLHIVSPKIWLAFTFITGITAIAYFVGYLGLKLGPEYSTFALLGAVIVKLLFSMVFVLIYTVKVSQSDVIFMLNFFSLYLCYTVFEMYSLLCNLRHQKLK